MQTQLANARRGGGNASRHRQFADAAKRQRRELAKTERAYNNRGCRGSNARRCRALAGTISEMRANLSRLERTRDRNRGRASPREVRRLERAVQQACRPQRETRTASVRRDTGTRTKANKQRRQPARQSARIAAPEPSLGSGYRTLCVRTCDGYFFPISFSTGKPGFERDQAVCAALCPAAPTMLFTHKSGDDEGPQNMSALDGTLYTDLQTAFNFRQQKRSPSCTCGRANARMIGVEGIIAPDEAKEEATDKTKTLTPLPRFRPDLAADPETQMNANQLLTPPRVIDIARSISVGQIYDVAENRSRVRVVGGEFLPDPEEAIDLTTPAPTTFP